MTLKASIDIGSNSILLLVADVVGEQISVLEDYSEVAGLGRGVQKTKVLAKEAMSDSYEILSRYSKIIEKHKIPKSDVMVTATEAARVAKNAVDFFNKVHLELGLTTSIISGQQEAYYTAKGVSLSSSTDDFTIMDIGGASTELTTGRKKPFEVVRSISMPMGAVLAKEWDESGVSEIKRICDSFPISDYETKSLVCVAGSMTTIACVYLGLSEFNADKIEGLKISAVEFQDFYQEFRKYTPAEILQKFPYVGKRAEVLIPGGLIASELIKFLNVENIIISTQGLRHGTILKGVK